MYSEATPLLCLSSAALVTSHNFMYHQMRHLSSLPSTVRRVIMAICTLYIHQCPVQISTLCLAIFVIRLVTCLMFYVCAGCRQSWPDSWFYSGDGQSDDHYSPLRSIYSLGLYLLDGASYWKPIHSGHPSHFFLSVLQHCPCDAISKPAFTEGVGLRRMAILCFLPGIL